MPMQLVVHPITMRPRPVSGQTSARAGATTSRAAADASRIGFGPTTKSNRAQYASAGTARARQAATQEVAALDGVVLGEG